MTTKTLRALAKEFSLGTTDQATYRKSRSELIEGIVAGEVPVAPIDFLPPLDLDEGDPTVEAAATMIRPEPVAQRPEPPPTPTKETHHYWLIGSGVVALICLFVLVVLFIKRDETPLQEPATMQQVTPMQPATSVIEAPTLSTGSSNLIEAFLNQNNWTVDSMQQFLADWQKLNLEEQTVGLNSPAISLLRNAIHNQLLEERALLGLSDNATVISKQQALVNFADEIGIIDPRLIVEGEVEQAIAVDETTQPNQTITDNAIDTDVQTSETTETIDPKVSNDITEQPLAKAIANESETIKQEITVADETVATLATMETVEETTPAENIQGPITTPPVTPPVTKATNKNACKAELARQRKPYCRDIISGAGNGPTLVVIRPGKFTMGGKEPTEQPQHEVTISDPFALSVREITFAEYQQFCEATQQSCPKQPWVGNDYPIVNVSWNDAIAYTTWLSEQTGNSYRLPNEAEWEYAARAGTTSTYPFGDEILITDAVFSDRKQLSAPLPKTDRSINRKQISSISYGR